MKNFFKENIALVAGIVLPFLLVTFFYLAGEFARQAVADPQYAVVFLKDYYTTSGTPYLIRIENGRIVAETKPKADNKNNENWGKPELFILEPGKDSARRIPLDFNSDAPGPVTSPDLDALNAMGRISTDPSAPDGYRFDYDSHYNGSLLGEIFGMRSGRESYYALFKSPRRIPVTAPGPLYSATFLGWVIPAHDRAP